MSSSVVASQWSFLDLPAEIRLPIYAALFSDARIMVSHNPAKSGKKRRHKTCSSSVALLSTSKLIRQESLPIFCAAVSLFLVGKSTPTNLPLAIPAVYLSHVQRVVVDVDKKPQLQVLRETIVQPDDLPCLRSIEVHNLSIYLPFPSKATEELSDTELVEIICRMTWIDEDHWQWSDFGKLVGPKGYRRKDPCWPAMYERRQFDVILHIQFVFEDPGAGHSDYYRSIDMTLRIEPGCIFNVLRSCRKQRLCAQLDDCSHNLLRCHKSMPRLPMFDPLAQNGRWQSKLSDDSFSILRDDRKLLGMGTLDELWDNSDDTEERYDGRGSGNVHVTPGPAMTASTFLQHSLGNIAGEPEEKPQVNLKRELCYDLPKDVEKLTLSKTSVWPSSWKLLATRIVSAFEVILKPIFGTLKQLWNKGVTTGNEGLQP